MATNNPPRLTLHAATAGDLMTTNPISIRQQASFQEALKFFVDRNVAAAPVINEAGRIIGVLSVTDLLVHVRESDCSDGAGVLATLMGPKTAGEMMTPTIVAVAKATPAEAVIRDMLQTHVHHVFVADEDTVVGVISTKDILRHLNSSSHPS